MQAPLPKRWTLEEYRAFEETSEIRHEFFDGQIYAMSGGSPQHAFIKENISIAIGLALRGKPCRSASSDLRVRVEATGFHGYPDVLVVCGEPKYPEDDGHSLLNPTIVVEVLSPSTERHDRVFKLDQYRRIPSLHQVLLVSQDEARVESYTPVETGWLLEVAAGTDAVVSLSAIDATLLVAEVYAGIDLAVPEAPGDPGS